MPVHQPNTTESPAQAAIPPDGGGFRVESGENGRRLDLVLAARFPERSRTAWKELLAGGLVMVNGRPAGKALVLREGWAVSLATGLPPAAPVLLPDPGLAAGLAIIHRDSWFVAVDKPAGVPCHPLAAAETGTMANALAALDPGFAGAGPKALEGGLVHRLDTWTSGLLLAACTPAAFAALSAGFRGHLADKRYLAIVRGRLEKDTVIDFPIAHHARDSRRMVAVRPGEPPAWRGTPRPARSELRVLECLEGMTVVEVLVRQAQMHQIRVHLAAIGHPLLADAVYAPPPPPAGWPGGLARHALHAWKLSLPHPDGSGRLELCAPLPADLAACIRAAGGRAGPA